jgi:hypothetical protein
VRFAPLQVNFKNLQPALKIYQVHSATFESGILENSDVLKRLYEIKKDTGLQIGIDKWITSK